MQPLVSILIPAFNVQLWIADTIKSAVGQTWPRKEIIIVDDGSTDQTLSIAQRFASSGVSVVAQPNKGAAAARNLAYASCHGDYIQWLDADDLLAPDKIARQIQALDACRNKRPLLSCAYGRFWYRWHKAEFCPTALWCDSSPADWLFRKLQQNLFMANSTWLVSRELTEAAEPWNACLTADDDGEYFCRVLLASDGVRFVPEARAYYRSSGFGSLSYVDRSDKKLESLCLSLKLHVAYLRSLENSERVRAACLDFLQRWLVCFYPKRLDLAKELEELAGSLGGQLTVPRLSWKYEWMRQTLGWDVAQAAQTWLPRLRWSLVRSWDKALFRMGC